MKRLDAELAKKTSDLNSMIMELTGRVKACEEDIAEGPDEMRGQDVDEADGDEHALSSMRDPNAGKSVHGELASGDDEDGVNIGEEMKNSLHKKSDFNSQESPSSKAVGNKTSNEMLTQVIQVQSKGSLQQSPPRRNQKSTKKLPPQSSQHNKSIDSKRSKKRGNSQDGNAASNEAVQNLELRLEELRK